MIYRKGTAMKIILCATVWLLSLVPMNGAEPGDVPKTELEGRWVIKDFELNEASPQLRRVFHGLSPDIEKKDRAGFLDVRGDKFFPLGKDKLRREAVMKLDASKD